MFLSNKEAADYVGLSEATLNRFRMTAGEGPVYYKVGRYVRYDKDDLKAWMKSRRFNSTSDAGCGLIAIAQEETC